jgi:hypothetical protein
VSDFDAAMSADAVVACADLVGRAGALNFQIGYLHEDVPVEQAGWYAHAQYKGARIIVEDRRSPSEACLALAERILSGGRCRCGQLATLSDGQPGCRWRLMGSRWEPGCAAPPVDIQTRGDLASMGEAMNRAARRRAARNRQAPRRWGR